MSAPTAAVLTVSDGVSAGTREDRSGVALTERLTASGFEVVAHEVVPDEPDEIAAAVRRLAAGARLVLTTGGTGFGPRDVTPEATREVIEREAPGLAEAMRAAGRATTPMADLSRGLVGAVGDALVINLPGSTRGAVESLDAILEVVPHALDLLAGRTRHGHADEHTHGPTEDHPPPPAATSPDVIGELQRRREAGEDVVLATAVRTEGDPPCEVGQKLLLGASTTLAGTLGCAEFDDAALADAADVLGGGAPRMAVYDHDDGRVEVALEPFVAAPTLVVLGATQVARWLLSWSSDIGYRTVLVESRPERVTDELRAHAGRVESTLEGLGIDERTAVVHTDHDAPGAADELARAVRAGAAFVGMMSSRRHAAAHLDAIREAGADPAAVRAPLGLDIGSRTPAEIALSILAGIVASRESRGGGWMGA